MIRSQFFAKKISSINLLEPGRVDPLLGSPRVGSARATGRPGSGQLGPRVDPGWVSGYTWVDPGGSRATYDPIRVKAQLDRLANRSENRELEID
jgi:hypothetical protein